MNKYERRQWEAHMKAAERCASLMDGVDTSRFATMIDAHIAIATEIRMGAKRG